MPSNTAAWLTSSKAKVLEVGSAPYTSPQENEIVIKNGAVGINPIDWLKQAKPGMIFPWIKAPFILGTDVAGEVVEVGRAVTRFKVGDRVVSHATGTNQERNTATECAFQEYTVLLPFMTSPIPSTLSYESAAVIPLGLSTAATGLFQDDQLALQLPSVPPKPQNNETLLVWGGSTSVGSNAIQLAVAAGYEVITTASPKNFDYVKKLGASQVFDYKSKTIVDDLSQAFKGKKIAGAMSIGHGAADACFDVLDKCSGNKFIAMVTYPVPKPEPESFVLLSTVVYFVSRSISYWFKSKARGIRYNLVFGSSLVANEIGKAIYQDFLPDALESTFIAAPDPQVVGKGLEYIQAGFDLQKKGMSARKVVVSL